MVNKTILAAMCVLLGSLLVACVTAVDNTLPYDQLPEITVATPFNLVASPSHPTAYLTDDLIAAGEKLQVVGTDKNAAWLLVLHNNLLGWMPTFYSRTNVATLKAPMVMEPLSDKCTKYLGATFAPDEAWVSNTSGAVFVIGSIYRPQTGKQFDDAALAIQIDGSGTATKSDYIHTMLTKSSAVVLFAFAIEDLRPNSQIKFDLTGTSDERVSFQAAFFSNDCAEDTDASQLLIGKTKVVALAVTPTPPDPTTAVTFIRAPTLTPTPRPTWEWNIDRQGSDYKNYNLSTDDPGLCQADCENDPSCKAWTYVKPNTIQGPSPRCWLKNAVPPAQAKNCCVSGVKDNN